MRFLIILLIILSSCKTQLEVDKCTNLNKKQTFTEEISEQENGRFMYSLIAGVSIVIHAITTKIIADKQNVIR